MVQKEKTESPGGTGFPACARESELRITRSNLPHWELQGSTYFITFRLKSGVLSEDERMIVLNRIKYFHKVRYLVTVAVVMPDHVHMILKPVDLEPCLAFSLSKILQGIKGFTAREINRIRNSKGALWLDESYDRIIRAEKDYLEKWQYIRHNPVEAGLCQTPEEYPFFWEPGEPLED